MGDPDKTARMAKPRPVSPDPVVVSAGAGIWLWATVTIGLLAVVTLLFAAGTLCAWAVWGGDPNG
jgi:hypothetical protein